MGLHGTATCEMRYDGAEAELLGAPHGGLAAIYTMMNQERISVGLQGYAQADRALQAALASARERQQGRAIPRPACPEAAPAPILEHPDVRRLLRDQRGSLRARRRAAGGHYMSRHLPMTALHLARIDAGAVAALPLDAAAPE